MKEATPRRISTGVRSDAVKPSRVDPARVDGTVKEALPNALFKVELKTGQAVHAHVAEELRLHALRILPGDQVILEISPFDLGRGRIVRRIVS